MTTDEIQRTFLNRNVKISTKDNQIIKGKVKGIKCASYPNPDDGEYLPIYICLSDVHVNVFDLAEIKILDD